VVTKGTAITMAEAIRKVATKARRTTAIAVANCHQLRFLESKPFVVAPHPVPRDGDLQARVVPFEASRRAESPSEGDAWCFQHMSAGHYL